MHPGEVLWGVSGLETPFYQALILFSTYYLIKGLKASDNHAIAKSALLLVIAGFTRPEAPMIFYAIYLSLVLLNEL